MSEKRWTLVGRVMGAPGLQTHTTDIVPESGPHLRPGEKVNVMPVSEAQHYREALEALVADFEAGGAVERDTDEPGIPSSVYFDCAVKCRAALQTSTQGGDASAAGTETERDAGSTRVAGPENFDALLDDLRAEVERLRNKASLTDWDRADRLQEIIDKHEGTE